MKIFVNILNYNVADHAIKLLQSLESKTDSHFEIVVIDNKSSDVQKLRDYLADKSQIHFIETGDNLGFAEGNNQGLIYSFEHGADWALILNPDIWVDIDFISKLKTELQNKTGLVGLPVDEGEKIAYGGEIQWLRTPSQLHHIYEADSEVHQRYVIGGAMLISKEAWQRLGPLDSKYFLYFEDTDYCASAYRTGISVSYIKQPIVHHSISESTKKIGSALLLRYHFRNALHFNYKNGPWYIKLLVWPWSWLIMGKQYLKIFSDQDKEISEQILYGGKDFYADRMGRIDYHPLKHQKIKVGIECENLEDSKSRWGVGKLVINLIEEYVKNPEWQQKFELHLYFKSKIPSDSVLQSSMLHKHIIGTRSFNLYYHIFLPIRAMRDRMDWMFFAPYMLPPLYLGKSIVMLTEDVYYEYKQGSLPFRYRLAYGLFTNWAARSADKILTISETSKKLVAKLYGIEPDRIFASRLGASINPTSQPNTHGDYILYVGQMFPRRSARESLLAFEKIAPDFPNLKFILVGADKYSPPQIDSEIKRLNEKFGSERVLHYTYIERDDELVGLYQHAKLFIYVSSREAFGLPPVEAAAYGIPVVVKDSELNHELFHDAAFFVTDEHNIDDFSKILRKGIIDDAKRKDIIEKYKTLIPELNWHSFAQRFFDQLNETNS